MKGNYFALNTVAVEGDSAEQVEGDDDEVEGEDGVQGQGDKTDEKDKDKDKDKDEDENYVHPLVRQRGIRVCRPLAYVRERQLRDF